MPRVGFRPLIRGGFAVTTAGAVLLYALAPTRGLWVVRVATLVFGIGMGFANTALLIAVQTSVAWELRGVVTASTMFFRGIGGALAVAVLGTVLNRELTRDPSAPLEAISSILGPAHGKDLPRELVVALGGSLATGLDLVFAIIAAMAVTAFLVGFAFPKLDVRALSAEASPPAAGHCEESSTLETILERAAEHPQGANIIG